MTPATSVLSYQPIFNDFLYAPIDAGVNGNPLSVLSAFTRLGVDPWKEAAELAALPREGAQLRLAGLLVRLPSRPWERTDAGSIACRLLELLPQGNPQTVPSPRLTLDNHQMIATPLLKVFAAAAGAIYMIALVLHNWLG
jgi:hypothetical protein